MGFLAVAPVCLCGDETDVGNGVTVGGTAGVVVRVGLGVIPGAVPQDAGCHKPLVINTHSIFVSGHCSNWEIC